MKDNPHFYDRCEESVFEVVDGAGGEGQPMPLEYKNGEFKIDALEEGYSEMVIKETTREGKEFLSPVINVGRRRKLASCYHSHLSWGGRDPTTSI